MRFGGHQTFVVREGWLSKALELLEHNPEAFARKDLADYLGVGANMAKSIEHWIVATGLATKVPTKEVHKTGIKYKRTAVGDLIWEHDPYLTSEETWWLLHLNVVNDYENAVTWNWFFNEFSEQRFEKAHLVSKLLQKEKSTQSRVPSEKTLERDVSCFLNTYSQPVPREKKDPEEDLGSPFQELRLMSALKSSGTYELHRRSRSIAPEVLIYSILKVLDTEKDRTDFSFTWLTRQRSGPLQTLALTADSLFEQLMGLEQEADQYDFSVRGLAGDRQITLRKPTIDELLSSLYARLN